MDYTRKISLDVNAASEICLVKAKQGDFGSRFLNVTLLKDGVKVSPESGDIATFRVQKPDGHAVVNSAVIESDGTITVEFTSQVTAVSGRSKADICLYKTDKSISTVTFVLEIVASPNVGNVTASSDQFEVLNKLFEEVSEKKKTIDDAAAEWNDLSSAIRKAASTATTEADAAESSAKTAKSYAVGGTSSRTGEDTDNAKYYYNQSSAFSVVSKSYAVGGTSSRSGEDTDNSKYYYQLAKQSAESITVATTDEIQTIIDSFD